MIVGEPVLSTFLNKWKTQLTSEIQEVKHSRERFLDLLLIADPSEKIVQQYLPKGHLFAFLNEGEAIGVVHLIPIIRHSHGSEKYCGQRRGARKWLWEKVTPIRS